MRSQLEQAQRNLKNSDAERNEATDRVGELVAKVSSLESARRKAEQQVTMLQEELDEHEAETKDNADKLRHAMEQNARLQSDLLSQQETANGLEKQKVREDTANSVSVVLIVGGGAWKHALCTSCPSTFLIVGRV